MMNKYISLILLSIIIACSSCNNNSPTDNSSYVPNQAMHKSQKRGVAFSFSRLDDAMLLSPSISWFYNWGPDFSGVELDNWFELDSVIFMPMAWNGSFDENRIVNYVLTHPDCKYLLAYNEPNLTDQARMTPTEAARQWPRLKRMADQLQLKVVSPAMNYGTLDNYFDPILWLDEFFSLVPLDDVDAIAIHCYMASPSALISYVDRFKKYGKPIWMTEFCAWDPVPANLQTQLSYMCSVLNYMEQEPMIDRYAWFIPRASGQVDSPPYMQLLTHTSPSQLTEAGMIYTSFSSFDKSVWLDITKPVAAKDYVALNDNNLQIRLCPDTTATMIYNFSEGQWVEYQLFFPTNISTLQICYNSNVNCSLALYIDGDIQDIVQLNRADSNNSYWQFSDAPISVSKGRHTLRILVGRGSLNMKYIKANSVS